MATPKSKTVQESVADFKARLSALMRLTHPEQFIKTDRPCLRKPTDRGYYPPSKSGGSGQRTIQQDDSAGILERPKTAKTTKKE